MVVVKLLKISKVIYLYQALINLEKVFTHLVIDVALYNLKMQ